MIQRIKKYYDSPSLVHRCVLIFFFSFLSFFWINSKNHKIIFIKRIVRIRKAIKLWWCQTIISSFDFQIDSRQRSISETNIGRAIFLFWKVHDRSNSKFFFFYKTIMKLHQFNPSYFWILLLKIHLEYSINPIYCLNDTFKPDLLE